MSSDDERFANLRVELADVEARMRRTTFLWGIRRLARSFGRQALQALVIVGSSYGYST